MSEIDELKQYIERLNVLQEQAFEAGVKYALLTLPPGDKPDIRTNYLLWLESVSK